MMAKVDPDLHLHGNEGCIEHGDNQEGLASFTFRYPGVPDTSLLEARLAWSNKVRNLALGCLRCDNGELKEVLKHHSKILDTLRLHDVLLMPSEPDFQSPRACLVKFIKWLEIYLNLKEVIFVGTSTNFGMQHWIVPVYLRSKLFQKIAGFIVNGGPCPLDSVEILSSHYDFGKKELTSRFSGFVDREKFVGYEDWQMKYYDLDQLPNGTGWPPEIELGTSGQ